MNEANEFVNCIMELSLEQRKQLYIEKVREEYIPVKVKWWESEKPLYHSTKEFALGYSGTINTGEPMVFKKLKKETLIWAVLLACISVLLYFVAKTFSFFHIVVIALFFVVFCRKS